MFMPESDRCLAQKRLQDLMQGLLNPNSSKRLKAQDMLTLDWLQAAAAQPLPCCPECIAMGIKHA